jgi:MEDS: MEthanogen/methylotroph, DcmR Sensory domain
MPVLECARCNELYYSAHGSTELSCDVCEGGTWRLFEDEVSFARVSGLGREPQAGDHAALLYTDMREGVDFCARYLADGIARGQRPVVAVPQPFREELLHRLPAEDIADAVVLDAESIYGPGFDPERVAHNYQKVMRDLACPVRGVCGPDGEAGAAMEIDEWRRYERLAHEVILGLDAAVLCTYDSRHLPIAFSPVAVETHPLIARGGGELRRNSDFRYEAAAT